MTLRAFAQILLLVMVVVVGVSIPSAAPLAPIALGVQLAYDGPRHRAVLGVALAVVLIELFWALDVGVLSLSYLGTALSMSVASVFVALTPWGTHDGWHIGDMVRAWLTASIASAAIVLGSVGVASLYGHGAVAYRLSLAFGGSWVTALLVGCPLLLIIMRRIAMPFRRPVVFGI